MRRLLLALLLLVPLGACEPEVRPAAPRFVTDEQGRALILHGVNLSGSAKGDPQRLPWVSEADVHRLARDWGFNFVRYLILWDALMPEPGCIDVDYLRAVAKRVDWMRQSGIYVVLDMHQDVYSRFFCCDGAPTWAIRADPQLLAAYEPLPVWSFNYFQEAVMQAFDAFWDHTGPHADLQDHYAAMWTAIADFFKDDPAVLGYDFINEPSPGSFHSGEEYFLIPEPPGGPHSQFDRTLFKDFYDRMIAAVRQVDPDGWIFYEPRFGTVAGGMPNYLPPLDDPRPGEDRLAYFPHFYSIQVSVTDVYDPDADRALALWESERKKELDAAPVPLLIGEFGTLDSTLNGIQHLREVVAMADRMTSGWAYWEYNDDGFGFLVEKGGAEKAEKLDVLVRTYPQRVAGHPLSYAYDPDTRVFELLFAEREGVTGPTLIYVPARRFYPQGFELEVSDPVWESEWDEEREILSLWTDPRRPVHRVRVRPAGPGP